MIQISTRPAKKGAWDGRYDLRLAGLLHTISRKDMVRITISAISVKTLNLLRSIGIVRTVYFTSAK
jgi:hypothetical protein